MTSVMVHGRRKEVRNIRSEKNKEVLGSKQDFSGCI
jgi:hypothetical protein